MLRKTSKRKVSSPVLHRCERGNLVKDAQGVLKLWGHHFSTLLRGEGATREDSEPPPIDDDEVEIPPPSHNEVRVAIRRLKNNKAAGSDGLPVELFKAGSDELVSSMHQLIYRIWLEESMPSDWNFSALCPVLKKGKRYAPNSGIRLLTIAYKVLTSVLCERLKPHEKALIGPYQYGFRTG